MFLYMVINTILYDYIYHNNVMHISIFLSMIIFVYMLVSSDSILSLCILYHDRYLKSLEMNVYVSICVVLCFIMSNSVENVVFSRVF